MLVCSLLRNGKEVVVVEIGSCCNAPLLWLLVLYGRFSGVSDVQCLASLPAKQRVISRPIPPLAPVAIGRHSAAVVLRAKTDQLQEHEHH